MESGKRVGDITHVMVGATPHGCTDPNVGKVSILSGGAGINRLWGTGKEKSGVTIKSRSLP